MDPLLASFVRSGCDGDPAPILSALSRLSSQLNDPVGQRVLADGRNGGGFESGLRGSLSPVRVDGAPSSELGKGINEDYSYATLCDVVAGLLQSRNPAVFAAAVAACEAVVSRLQWRSRRVSPDSSPTSDRPTTDAQNADVDRLLRRVVAACGDGKYSSGVHSVFTAAVQRHGIAFVVHAVLQAVLDSKHVSLDCLQCVKVPRGLRWCLWSPQPPLRCCISSFP